MELQVVKYYNTAYYIDAIPLCSIYLWKDGTLNRGSTGYDKVERPKEMSDAPGYWRIEQEAQQFLDNWMPRKEQLTIQDVARVATKSEKLALDCSIEHWKQNVLDVGGAHLGSSYCAVCIRAGIERDNVVGSWRNGKSCPYCIVNNYKVGDVGNCCKEYKAFCDNKTEENAIAMLNKLVLIRNNKYGNPYTEKAFKINLQKAVSATATIYDEYVKMNTLYGGNKMNKIVFDDGKEVELSKETTERLRKELVKPEIEWRHGDIASSYWCAIGNSKKRLILIEAGDIKIYDNTGFRLYQGYSQDCIKDRMEEYKYERIGNLFDDFSN